MPRLVIKNAIKGAFCPAPAVPAGCVDGNASICGIPFDKIHIQLLYL